MMILKKNFSSACKKVKQNVIKRREPKTKNTNMKLILFSYFKQSSFSYQRFPSNFIELVINFVCNFAYQSVQLKVVFVKNSSTFYVLFLVSGLNESKIYLFQL